MTRLLLASIGTGVALGLASQASAAIIFDDDFVGAEDASITTSAPEVGTGSWTGTILLDGSVTGAIKGAGTGNPAGAFTLGSLGGANLVRLDMKMGTINGGNYVASLGAGTLNVFGMLGMVVLGDGGLRISLNGSGTNVGNALIEWGGGTVTNGSTVSMIVNLSTDTADFLVDNIALTGGTNVSLVTKVAANGYAINDVVDFKASDAEKLATRIGVGSGTIDNLTVSTIVPEPGSLALIGLGGLLIARRRR